MYFIKTKGTEKVADFVQIRDENYALIEQIKLTALEKKLSKIFGEKANYVFKLINKTKNDQLTKI